jgi:serine protease Do
MRTIALNLRRHGLTLGLALATALAAAWLPAAPVRAQPTPTVALPDFTELVERVGPAVVNIRTAERNGRSATGSIDPGMEELLRRFGIPVPRQGDPRRGAPREEDSTPQPRGVGSGFIISADGFVMTNAHVVDGADEITVTLTDKREFKARVIGLDTRTDVAVVKIEATGLPTVRFGDVNRLKVGEWVVAIGSPFGFDNSVTAGIVSAKARDTGDYLPFIQTDVAINPGNSGGPLLNLRGEVVGINSQIYSRSGGFMGISFAIPIDEAQRVAEQLRANGRVIRGRIGVSIAPVTREVAESIGLGKAAGALIQSVESGGPAEKGGIEAGDIITRVDGKAVEKSSDLPRLIGGIRPGSRATLQVFRRGQTRDVAVTVAEFEPERSAARRTTPAPGEAPAAKNALGIGVAELTDAQKRDLRVRNGVRVESVEGAAARSGLREGDVILSINNVEVTDSRQFAAQVARVDRNQPVSLLVRREQWTNFIIIRPSR